MAEPEPSAAPPSPAETAAGEVCRLAKRAVEDDRPLFVVVFYRHEGEKLDFLAALRRDLGASGLHSRTLDPARDPAHGTGKLYSLLAGDRNTVHLVADLARGDDGRFDPGFLDYLNLHRDRINRETLRWVLLLHDSEAEPFLRQAGDLWDFRQRTIWLERGPEPRGELLWQELGERTRRLPLGEDERREIDDHVAAVRAQVQETTTPEDRAALLGDLSEWLLRRHAAAPAAEAALDALGLAGEQPSQLRLDLELGTGDALYRLQQHHDALSHYEEALRLGRALGDLGSEGLALNEISQIYHAWGRYDEALETLQKSLFIFREVGDRAREAVTLNNIAGIYGAWGRYDEALEALQQSLSIRREVGDRAGEAVTLNNISQVYRARGRNDEALEALLQSLSFRREVGDRAGEAVTLNNIAGIYRAWGRYDEALEALQQSLSIHREVGDRAGEAVTLNNISQIYDAWGGYDEALEALQQSLAICREVGDRAGEAVTLSNISQIYAAWGRYDEALEGLEQSLAIQGEIGDRAGEAVTCWNLGREYERRGELDLALEHLRRAVELEEELAHPDLEQDREYLEAFQARLDREGSSVNGTS